MLQDGRHFCRAPPLRKDDLPSGGTVQCTGTSAGTSDDHPNCQIAGEDKGSAGGIGENGTKHGGGEGDSEYGGRDDGQVSDARRKRRRHGGKTAIGVFYTGHCLQDEASVGEKLTDMHHRPLKYDKVLVDAECTHDGSIKHLAKFSQWGWDSFERRFLEPSRLRDLAQLQAGLLRVGFHQLRPGGALIYSTCSFARAQNEDIVAALLEEEPRAWLMPIDSLAGAPCRPGALEHTIRFEPRLSKTSGLFIARLGKLPDSQVQLQGA